MEINEIIDLASWQQRNLQVGYGTRDKIVLKATLKGKVYFLAKTYDKDIGELRSEVCASSIGRLFGFPVQRTWLCRIPQHVSLGLSHPIGVLIQLDVRRQKDTRRGHFREDLVHGADLIAFVDKVFASVKDIKKKRTVYTLTSTVKAIRKYVQTHPGSEKVWDQFFELLTFDALIGGTDRHYYNWGVLQKADNARFLRLAPAFDNGASLLWNLEAYGPEFLKDPWAHSFALRAPSMFKRDLGGKYRLTELLEALHSQGDYQGSLIAGDILDRLCAVNPERILSTLLRNVPQSPDFKTSEAELKVVALYAMDRLGILKDTLARIAGR